MNRFGIGICVATLLLITVGCIEKSVVIKVKRDGSGVIHVRDFQQSAKLGFSFGGSKKTDKTEESKPKVPSGEELSRVARELGSGVTVQSVSAAKNDAGWNGFEVIFAFEKVDDLTINKGKRLMSLGKKKSDSPSKPDESEKMKEDLNIGNEIRFELKEGMLVVHQTPLLSAEAIQAKSRQTEPATKDPFGNEPKSAAGIEISTSSVMEGLFINALKDARIGMFIELEDGIGQTNALYHDDNQVTLFKAVLGPLIQQKAKLEELRSLSKNLEGKERQKASQDLVETIDGMDIDMSETLTIAFRADESGS